MREYRYYYAKISHDDARISYDYAIISHDDARISYYYTIISHDDARIPYNYARISHDYARIPYDCARISHDFDKSSFHLNAQKDDTGRKGDRGKGIGERNGVGTPTKQLCFNTKQRTERIPLAFSENGSMLKVSSKFFYAEAAEKRKSRNFQ